MVYWKQLKRKERREREKLKERPSLTPFFKKKKKKKEKNEKIKRMKFELKEDEKKLINCITGILDSLCLWIKENEMKTIVKN